MEIIAYDLRCPRHQAVQEVAPYLRVADRLRSDIEEGRLKPGDRLPSSPMLARKMSIAKATAERALRVLKDEGLAISRVGSGTYVCPRPDPGVRRWRGFPPIEVVTTGAGEEPLVFLYGRRVPTSWLDADAGAGWSWSDWCAHRDETLAAASPAAREVLEEAFARPGGGEFVTGRGAAGWLDPLTETGPAAAE